jgi:hypothetical protein
LSFKIATLKSQENDEFEEINFDEAMATNTHPDETEIYQDDEDMNEDLRRLQEMTELNNEEDIDNDSDFEDAQSALENVETANLNALHFDQQQEIDIDIFLSEWSWKELDRSKRMIIAAKFLRLACSLLWFVCFILFFFIFGIF